MARTGSQTPTSTVTIPYSRSHGKDAVKLYQNTGRTAMKWQKSQIDAILAVNKDGLWTHTTYGLAVPRRNGKNEVVVMRELYGLEHKEQICHTAHRTSTSHAAFERLVRLLRSAGYEEITRKKKAMPKKSFFASKQYGLEYIELTDGGAIHFRTRTNNGGLGEGFDLLIIDEAQEYTELHQSALIYTVSDSPNPQTILCGTPPTVASGGTVFPKLRDDILGGIKANAGWAEWGIEKQMDDIYDVDLWYLTNPSMGNILTERKVRDEITSDVIDFQIQRLGLWLRYNQKSAISAAEWDELCGTAELSPDRYIGIKYGRDGANAAMAIASKTTDGRIFVEAIDCVPIRAGNAWMMQYLSNPHIKKIAVDGNGQSILADDMKAAGIGKKPIMPTVKEIIVANAMFEKHLYAKKLVHSGQPSLAQAVSNCEKRAIGSTGGFGYRSINDMIDVSLMDAVILAQWLCEASKAERKQRISY